MGGLLLTGRPIYTRGRYCANDIAKEGESYGKHHSLVPPDIDPPFSLVSSSCETRYSPSAFTKSDRAVDPALIAVRELPCDPMQAECAPSTSSVGAESSPVVI